MRTAPSVRYTTYVLTFSRSSSVAPGLLMPVSVPATPSENHKVLQDEFAKGGKFQYLLLRYTQALITQISQTAVCNRLHSVEQQLCRWLLLSHDRPPAHIYKVVKATRL